MKYVIQSQGKFVALTTARNGAFHLTHSFDHAYQCSKPTAEAIVKKMKYGGQIVAVSKIKKQERA